MTALPSAGELQTGRGIGGSRSCCSHTPALHLPVGKEYKLKVEKKAAQNLGGRSLPQSDLGADNMLREISHVYHQTNYSEPEVIYRSASQLMLQFRIRARCPGQRWLSDKIQWANADDTREFSSFCWEQPTSYLPSSYLTYYHTKIKQTDTDTQDKDPKLQLRIFLLKLLCTQPNSTTLLGKSQRWHQ